MNGNAKQQLRQNMLQDRENLSPDDCQKASDGICAKLVELPLYKKAATILFYMSIRNEVDLKKAIEHTWKMRKRVLLPRIDQKQRKIEAVEIQTWDQLQIGAYGILEPEQLLKSFDINQIDLVIVPGVAFDLSGYRLGYGGGYYDRLFANFPHLMRIGVAYPNQIVSTVYPESHDQPLHVLLTSERCYFLDFQHHEKSDK